jgi:hypothetical protein
MARICRSDLKKAWTALAEAQKRRPNTPETLLPLTASAEEMRKREQTTSSEPMYRIYVSNAPSNEQPDPGHVFARHQVMQAVIQAFNYGLTR